MAEKIMCVNKIRDAKGNIKLYQLVTETGNKIEATTAQVKEEIRSGRYDFINLQIDKAGRLVDKAVKTEVTDKRQANKSAAPKKSDYQIAVEQFKRECKRYEKETYIKYTGEIDEINEDTSHPYMCNEDECRDIKLKKFMDFCKSKELKVLINKLISDTLSRAKQDKVKVYRPFWEESDLSQKAFLENSTFPESVVKFVKDTGANGNFLIDLFEYVASLEEVPAFEWNQDVAHERFFVNYSAMMTSNKGYMVKYITMAYNAVKESFDEEEETFDYVNCMEFLGNKKGELVFRKYKVNGLKDIKGEEALLIIKDEVKYLLDKYLPNYREQYNMNLLSRIDKELETTTVYKIYIDYIKETKNVNDIFSPVFWMEDLINIFKENEVYFAEYNGNDIYSRRKNDVDSWIYNLQKKLGDHIINNIRTNIR